MGTNCHPPYCTDRRGGRQKLNCATAKGVFRLIQSIPSPHAEPFKQWLARVGYERLQEEADPGLAIERAITAYKRHGKDDAWIKQRMEGIMRRRELTDEWSVRGITEPKEYAFLTHAMSVGTFDVSVAEHKKAKKLNSRANLRDHMSKIELALLGLGEATAAEITRERDAQGFRECRRAAVDGAEVAGEARRNVEQRLGRSVITPEKGLPTQARLPIKPPPKRRR